MDIWHWFQHLSGADDPSGHWYTFWSGFGADVGEIALLGAALGLYRKHNCHVHKCWRIAKQDVEGTSWKVCHKHHPDGKPTVETIAAAVQRNRASRANHEGAIHVAEQVAERVIHRDDEQDTAEAGQSGPSGPDGVHPPST